MPATRRKIEDTKTEPEASPSEAKQARNANQWKINSADFASFEDFKNSLHLTKTVRILLPAPAVPQLEAQQPEIESKNDVKIYIPTCDNQDDFNERCVFLTSNQDQLDQDVEPNGRNYKIETVGYQDLTAVITSLSQAVIDIAKLAKPFFEGFHALIHGAPAEAGEVFETRIMLYHRSAGLIIGSKGSNIQNLENMSQARLKVKELNCPDSSDKIFVMAGKEESLMMCLTNALSQLRLANIYNPSLCDDTRNFYSPEKIDPTKPDYGSIIPLSSELTPVTRADIEREKKTYQQNSYLCIRFLCPAQHVGLLIGKGAETRKRLISTYNCGINMRRDRAMETDDRVVELYTDNVTDTVQKSKVRECFLECLEILADGLRENAESLGYRIYDFEKDHEGNRLDGAEADEIGDHPDIPQDKLTELKMLLDVKNLPHVVGIAGKKIKEIRDNNNTAMKVYAEMCPNSSEKIMTVSGKVKDVYSSVCEVLDLLADFNHKIDVRYTGNWVAGYMLRDFKDYGGFMTCYGSDQSSGYSDNYQGGYQRGRGRGGFRGRGNFRGRGRGGYNNYGGYNQNNYNQNNFNQNNNFNNGGFNNTQMMNNMQMQMQMFNQQMQMMSRQMQGGTFGGLNMSAGNANDE